MSVFNLVNVQVVVDNIPWPIVNGSFSFIEGTGTIDTKSALVGTNVTVTRSLNLEEAFGQFKFMIRNTQEDVERASTISQNKLLVGVTISGSVKENNQPFTRSFNNATIINDPEYELSPDAETELEWTSDPAV